VKRHVVIVGGSLTGNKGAASMVLAVLDGLRREEPDTDVTVMTPLAAEDRGAAEREGVTLLPFGPTEIVLAVIGAVLCRLTFGRVAMGPVRALRTADAVADVSGISFVDGRGVATLAYNVLLVLPALLLGRPVVKISQAMGPFEQSATRSAARLILPRLTGLLARGRGTLEHLEELGVRNDGLAADVAFLMQTTPDDDDWAAAEVDRPFVAIAPSQVVADQAKRIRLDYVGHIIEIVDELSTDHDVVLIAHSARPGRPAGRLNDIPLCEEILARTATPERCRMASPTATPRQLRALIGRSDILVASRFHAMISALATCTPVLVVGWSHKYREVLAEFGLEELASDFRELDAAGTAARARKLLDRRAAVSEQTCTALPTVLDSARHNLDVLQHPPLRSDR